MRTQSWMECAEVRGGSGDYTFFLIWWYWGLTTEPHACLAGTPSLEPHQPHRQLLYKILMSREAEKRGDSWKGSWGLIFFFFEHERNNKMFACWWKQHSGEDNSRKDDERKENTDFFFKETELGKFAQWQWTPVKSEWYCF